jgi:transcriptional regulator with PAS, ATPase and Fis domain
MSNSDVGIKELMKSLGIVGESEAIIDVFKKVTTIAPSDSIVMLYGESGVGKELFAEAIHKLSKRYRGPFVKINCAAIPETLLESELFGHEKGSFTGATKRKLGLFELANSGSLFLDEIGEIPPLTQVKLLRVIEEKKIVRVGGIEYIPIDTRLILATNRDLFHEVKKGTFREDLFFRINVVSIFIPPLRDRKEDIIPLLYHFVDLFSKRENKKILKIEDEYIEFLMNYPFPGNIRELSNFAERGVILSEDGILRLETIHEYALHIPYMLNKVDKVENLIHSEDDYISEKDRLSKFLTMFNFNITKTASALGIHRNTLMRKMKKYKIQKTYSDNTATNSK